MICIILEDILNLVYELCCCFYQIGWQGYKIMAITAHF
jgi:hypothetical protein